MNTNLQKGQKVSSPDGGGLVESIIGEQVTVKLNSGETKIYHADQVQDDSDAG